MDTSVSEPLVSPAIAGAERFAFGRNWARFLTVLDEQRIASAELSLLGMLGGDDLADRTFLDIGSGSGLFSLAARRLGARVRSFDYDPDSVACTRELKRRYFPADPDWLVTEGSALDQAFLESLGTFDVVYSWGVLHHTGDLWRALDLACLPVAPGGRLLLAIYNDTGSQTARWKRIKRAYCRLPDPLRVPFVLAVSAPAEAKALARAIVSGQPGAYLKAWRSSSGRTRGMSRWHDIVDWVGGYPYEAARPDDVFAFYRDRGFVLSALKTGGGLGCNEFLFERPAPPVAGAGPAAGARP
jgi:2-polyprenyl-6-hydroxyphenyl methylase/3-demethylubiquinone-9 3-methyltransferase